MMSAAPKAALVQAARVMAIDEMTGEVVGAFAEVGLESILLKGPSIARWLYPDGSRLYNDTDLLVDPACFGEATSVLSRLGFGSPSRTLVQHAHTYRRVVGDSTLCVDLHRTLPLVTVPAPEVWRACREGTEAIQVARAEVQVLGIPQRLLHIAIHSVQHALESEMPSEDLRRALVVADRQSWVEAAGLSRRLGCEDALATGLCLLPEGAELAGALDLTTERRGILRMAATAEVDTAAYQLQRMLDADGWVERLKLMMNPLFMSPATLREDSALARRGGAALVLAYAARPFVLARRLGPAILARRRILGPHD